MANLAEIDEAVTAEVLVAKITLLKCTSSYPADPNNVNLKTIPNLEEVLDVKWDYLITLWVLVAIGAISLGASIIEKHFTLNRADGGIDSAFSMEPHEFSLLRKEGDKAWQALGNIHYGGTDSEIKSKDHRRSIYIGVDLAAGEELNSKNMRIIRPGFGLPPKYFDKLKGYKVKRDISAGTPITWDLLKE